ncbi:hypothetical protein [Mycobacterium lepromatosis]|uniref:hypothetical protein n=1 Tax=Mycobacterium lepromatosis TaxID=480418 RepID=UPI00138E3C24|nr:hypothetical protein [Mycobacterium lepromatosis]
MAALLAAGDVSVTLVLSVPGIVPVRMGTCDDCWTTIVSYDTPDGSQVMAYNQGIS